MPYILRVSIDAGTPAAKNGVFKTNFPLDGGKFGRDKFAQRKYVICMLCRYAYMNFGCIQITQRFLKANPS